MANDARDRLSDATQGPGGVSGGVPRLLPWNTEDGKSCYLSPASEGGTLSRLADAMEAEQIRNGREVLAQARGLMDAERLGNQELRFIAARVTECLADVLRVAESRGIRLDADDPTVDDDAEELEDAESAE